MRLWGDPQVTRFIASRALDASQVHERLAREMDTQRTCGMQYWPVFLRADGAFVGCCGLRPRAQAPDEPEFGVHLLPLRWGQGHAMEAASRVIDHAFGAGGHRALFAGHHPDNLASRRLLARLGFVHTHDECYPPTGLMHPSYRLSRPVGA